VLQNGVLHQLKIMPNGTGGTGGAGDIFGGIGNIFGAFGSKKLKQIEYLKGAGKGLEDVQGLLAGDRSTYTDPALAAFAEAQKKRAQLYDTEGTKARGQLENLFAERMGSAYDPLTVERQLRSERLGDLSRFAGDLAAQGMRQENLARANLGYSGGRTGSFAEGLRQSRIGQSLAPQFGSIISGLTPSVAGIVAGRQSQLGDLGNLINQRLGLIGLGQGIELSPAQAAMAARGGETALRQGLIDAARSNVAGFQKKQNWADITNQAFQGLGQTVGGIASLYTGGLGGGLGGLGGLGGMMGGGAGGGGSNPNFSGAQGTGVQWLNRAVSGLGGQLPNYTSVENWGELTPSQQYDYLQQINRAQQIGDYYG
jgi:hypothetical protein